MKRSICALTLCLALLAGLLTPTALAAGEKPAFSQQPQSTTVTAPDTNPAPNPANDPAGDLPGASMDRMLRNGRVHDRDGDLLDGENSVTPGTDRW